MVGSTYEIHGEPQSASEPKTSYMSPFGAYTGRTCPDVLPPHPPRPKNTKFKKTIMIVSLSKRGKGKDRQRLEYSTVTQAAVNLSQSQCTVQAVAELVAQQVGFEVVLLDSKCYQLLNTEGTSGVDFWKSTRKILAASRSLYEKVTGLAPQAHIIERAAIDLTVDNDSVPGPSKGKRPITKVDDGIAVKIARIDKRLAFLDELSQAFNCIICKSMSVAPVVSPCCQRVIGCQSCSEQWFNTNTRCPLCSISGRAQERFQLKGFDDVLAILLAFNYDPSTSSKDTTRVSNDTPLSDSDSDFEDFPPFAAGGGAGH